MMMMMMMMMMIRSADVVMKDLGMVLLLVLLPLQW
jgi:hypothetical protein